VATFHISFVEPALDTALAAGQLLAYLGFHLKSLRVCVGSYGRATMKPRQCPEDFYFFRQFVKPASETSLG